ncbi:MAG TPA: tetratricopeptide repeat protein [Chloroflexota bacterium]|nr:tetratricopeptide repeat protein [Chloroflexota bacterium]
MGRWTFLALTTAVSVALVAVVIGGAQRTPWLMQRLQSGPFAALGLSAGAPASPASPTAPFAAVKSPAWSTTDKTLTQLQDGLKTKPEDAGTYAQLGSLYMQKAREMGDPTYYAKAEGAVKKSLELAPDNVLATVVMGGLHMARHDFEAALTWGEKARDLAPRGYVIYGIIGDANIELGRYEAAIDAFQTMVDLRPDLVSLSRVSYARELHGDLLGAIESMQQAVDAGSPRSEATNWSRIQLANLYFLTGDFKSAEQQYAMTLHLLPNYVHGLAGQARLEAAKGNLKGAVRQYEQIVQTQPLPEYVAALADAYRATGDTAGAAKQVELMRVIAQLQRASGVDVDLDMALFEVDHAPDAKTLETALTAARSHYERRPSVHAADVLGWALYRANRPAEALPYARESLKLGSKDPVVLYHAGAIAAAAGQDTEARGHLEEALAKNDAFHVRYAPEAKKLLAQLGSAR